MSFGTTVMQIFSLVFIMTIGYILRKKNIFDSGANVRFTRLLIYVSIPAQIIQTFVSNQGIISNREVLAGFGITALTYLLYAIVGILFNIIFRVSADKRGMYLFMMMFANIGFMGFPLIEALLGETALVYAVISCIVFYLLAYSVGIFMIGKTKDRFCIPIRKLLNVPLIASVVSIILYFGKIRLPGMLMQSLNFMGDITTPVAMLILGITIAEMPWKELFDEWHIYVFTVFKLLLVPILVMKFLALFPNITSLAHDSLILLSATPVATNATMLAIEYDGDKALASKGIFFTTLLCMLTIPLIQILV